jgi:hypothetical protein
MANECIQKWYEREELGFMALQLLRSTQGSLGSLKLVTEGLLGNFTNWPEDRKAADKLMEDIREMANDQRLKAKFKEIDRLAKTSE